MILEYIIKIFAGNFVFAGHAAINFNLFMISAVPNYLLKIKCYLQNISDILRIAVLYVAFAIIWINVGRKESKIYYLLTKFNLLTCSHQSCTFV